MPRLENWSTTAARSDPYVPPEMRGISLQGKVYEHINSGRFPDGTQIVTTPIWDVNGTIITTVSGSIYWLGEPDPKWLEWLAKEGKSFDPINPIKFKGLSHDRKP